MKSRKYSYSFHRTNVQTRSRGHTAVGALSYRFALEAESLLPDKHGEPKRFDYRRRRGILQSGCALPPRAHSTWSKPVYWAHEIEKRETRSNSRLMRDDVLGIPVELVEAGVAHLAVARYAARIAWLRETPVHFVIHGPNRGNNNVHAHVLYAGRRLKKNGCEFEKKRDRDQDKPALISEHKQIWKEVCAEFDVILDFSGPVSREPRKHLGPKWAAIERKERIEEAADQLYASMQGADASVPLHDRWTRRLVGSLASDVNGLTTTNLIDSDRQPRTRAARRARRPRLRSESNRRKRLTRAIRDELVLVGEGRINRRAGDDDERGFLTLVEAPKSNEIAVRLVDGCLSSHWSTRGVRSALAKERDKGESNGVRDWQRWCERKSDRSENWTNAHAFSLEVVEAIWQYYEKERKKRKEEERKAELAELTQALATEVVGVGEKRIRDRFQNRAASVFRALAETPGEMGAAVCAIDECISVVLGEDMASSTSAEERNALVERWRGFCSRKSTKQDEVGLTHGQAVAAVVAVRVLGRRWEEGAITESLRRQVKNQILGGIGTVVSNDVDETTNKQLQQRIQRNRDIAG